MTGFAYDHLGSGEHASTGTWRIESEAEYHELICHYFTASLLRQFPAPSILDLMTFLPQTPLEMGNLTCDFPYLDVRVHIQSPFVPITVTSIDLLTAELFITPVR